jgi:hypothetical protein
VDYQVSALDKPPLDAALHRPRPPEQWHELATNLSIMRYGCPVLCVLAMAIFLKIHFRADEVPDYLRQQVGTYFNPMASASASCPPSSMASASWRCIFKYNDGLTLESYLQ